MHCYCDTSRQLVVTTDFISDLSTTQHGYCAFRFWVDKVCAPCTYSHDSQALAKRLDVHCSSAGSSSNSLALLPAQLRLPPGEAEAHWNANAIVCPARSKLPKVWPPTAQLLLLTRYFTSCSVFCLILPQEPCLRSPASGALLHGWQPGLNTATWQTVQFIHCQHVLALERKQEQVLLQSRQLVSGLNAPPLLTAVLLVAFSHLTCCHQQCIRMIAD